MVSCPHYLAEIIIYCGLVLLMSGQLLALLILVWVVSTTRQQRLHFDSATHSVVVCNMNGCSGRMAALRQMVVVTAVVLSGDGWEHIPYSPPAGMLPGAQLQLRCCCVLFY